MNAELDLPDLSVPWTLPSTRAGGQDDVSSEQTLSNYVAMLIKPFFVFQQDVMRSACLHSGLQQLESRLGVHPRSPGLLSPATPPKNGAQRLHWASASSF